MDEGHLGRFDVATCDELMKIVDEVLVAQANEDAELSELRSLVQCSVLARFKGQEIRNARVVIGDIVGIPSPHLHDLTANECRDVLVELDGY